jgi:hypothetical protein
VCAPAANEFLDLLILMRTPEQILVELITASADLADVRDTRRKALEVLYDFAPLEAAKTRVELLQDELQLALTRKAAA